MLISLLFVCVFKSASPIAIFRRMLTYAVTGNDVCKGMLSIVELVPSCLSLAWKVIVVYSKAAFVCWDAATWRP